MNIHLPAILGFTRYQGFDPSPYENDDIHKHFYKDLHQQQIDSNDLTVSSLKWSSPNGMMLFSGQWIEH